MITEIKLNGFQSFQGKTRNKHFSTPQKVGIATLVILTPLVTGCQPKQTKDDFVGRTSTSYVAKDESRTSASSFDEEISEHILRQNLNARESITEEETTKEESTTKEETTAPTTKKPKKIQTTYQQVKKIAIELAQAIDKRLGNGFSAKVEKIAENLKCDPNDLLAIMYSESGIDPHLQDPGGATGLIQFLPSTAKSYGVTTSELKNMSGIEQLDYVERLFRENKRTFLSSSYTLDTGTLYSLAFLPSRAEKEVQCASDGVLSGAYKENRGLDIDKDGVITKSDLTARLEGKYDEMYSNFV